MRYQDCFVNLSPGHFLFSSSTIRLTNPSTIPPAERERKYTRRWHEYTSIRRKETTQRNGSTGVILQRHGSRLEIVREALILISVIPTSSPPTHQLGTRKTHTSCAHVDICSEFCPQFQPIAALLWLYRTVASTIRETASLNAVANLR